jgi:hypothetical protein
MHVEQVGALDLYAVPADKRDGVGDGGADRRGLAPPSMTPSTVTAAWSVTAKLPVTA